jgi:hypothetical protein
MLTRRGFLGTLAALAASRVAPVPVAAAPVPGTWAAVERATFPAWRAHVPASSGALTPEAMRHLFDSCRRDDGDTILELR